MTITAVDPLSKPQCALYTSELIRNLQQGDERRVGIGPSHYGKCNPYLEYRHLTFATHDYQLVYL
jgi:hypothetical protein